MVVVGPTGRRVRLPCFDGTHLPRARARGRDPDGSTHALQAAAVDAGAVPVRGSGRPTRCGPERDRRLRRRRRASDPRRLRDRRRRRHQPGGRPRGLVDPARVLWGFAVRSYLDQPVELPGHRLVGADALAGVPRLRLGLPRTGRRRQRRARDRDAGRPAGGAAAVRALPAFLAHLAGLGSPRPARRRAGDRAAWAAGSRWGWSGPRPAAGRVLLVGDAAGLVNPLQGEGIAQAMTSGRCGRRGRARLARTAAERYRAGLARTHLPYHRITAALHAALVGRPRAVAVVGRVLTAPVVGPALAGGWAIFWNELLEGSARAGRGRWPRHRRGRGHGDRPDPGGALVRRRLRASGMSVAQPVVRCRLTRAMPSPHEVSWSAGR